MTAVLSVRIANGTVRVLVLHPHHSVTAGISKADPWLKKKKEEKHKIPA